MEVKLNSKHCTNCIESGFGGQGDRAQDETAFEACQRACCIGRITEETAGSGRGKSSEVADGIHQATD